MPKSHRAWADSVPIDHPVPRLLVVAASDRLRPWTRPPTLYWELIVEDGEVVGVICPDCLTLGEQRRIRAEHARVIRRLKRGLPL